MDAKGLVEKPTRRPRGGLFLVKPPTLSEPKDERKYYSFGVYTFSMSVLRGMLVTEPESKSQTRLG